MEEERLTEQEVNQVLNVFDFLEFSNSYRSTFNSVYNTPDIINRRLQDINMNPVDGTVEDIIRALKNPKDSETILRNFAMSFELQNMYYKRLVRFQPDMALFNLTFDVKNLYKPSEYNSKAFKDDLKVLDDFCSKFDYKKWFQEVFRQLIRQGVYYCVLRETEDKYSLQELPADFCKITGRFSYGLLFDFDFNWFIGQYGVDINMYPKVFKKMYREVFNKVSQKYNPAKSLNHRNSTFVYWHQCQPSDGFWCFKINPEVATLFPYYSALFPDISLQPTIRNLQTDKYFIQASKLLVGLIGFNKDKSSGQVTNQINITPDLLGKFLGVARQGLARQIGLTALPMDDVKAVEFDVDNDNLIEDQLSSVTKQSVASSVALFTDEKLNSHQSKLAAAIDANFIKSTYAIFSDFIEYFVNSRTKKYKFTIRFNDVDTPDDNTDRLNSFKTLASMGIVDIQQLARVKNMNVFELQRALEYSKATNFVDNLIPLMSLNNQSNNMKSINSPGRPEKPGSDNDNTIASRDSGANEE